VSKFKPGDVVFYKNLGTNPDIIIRIVVSEQKAIELYKKIYLNNIVKQILREEKPKNPVWITCPKDTTLIGWMPEKKLHLMSPAMQVLYGLKPE